MEHNKANTDCSDKNIFVKSDQMPEKENVLTQNLIECNKKRKLTTTEDATQTSFKALKSDTICNDTVNVATKCLLDLNDDCLEEIFKYLNIREQFNLARTCVRFNDFFLFFNNFHHTALKLSDLKDMKLSEVRNFYFLVGHFITRIDGNNSSFPFHQYGIVAQHCKNVTHLSLKGGYFHTQHSYAFFSEMTKIVELNLFSCGLVDESIIPLCNLQYLKELNLSYNKSLTGKHINTLSNTIEILSLSNCKSLEAHYMIAFCISLINLKQLDLNDCFKEFPQLDLSGNCKMLEMLEISAVKSKLIPFAKLPKLKRLGLYGLCNFPNIFKKLIKHKAEQLEDLTIMGDFDRSVAQQISQLHALRKLVCRWNYSLDDKALDYYCNLANLEEIMLMHCPEVNNATLMRLILNCTKLRLIHLQFCFSITNELIFDLIKELRAQIESNTYKRQERIIFEVYQTNIKNEILNNSDYKAAKDILRIHF